MDRGLSVLVMSLETLRGFTTYKTPNLVGVALKMTHMDNGIPAVSRHGVCNTISQSPKDRSPEYESNIHDVTIPDVALNAAHPLGNGSDPALPACANASSSTINLKPSKIFFCVTGSPILLNSLAHIGFLRDSSVRNSVVESTNQSLIVR